MSSYNRVTLLGNLTRDPELKKLESGATVVNFAVAMTDSYRTAGGERVEKPCYVDVEVWNDLATSCDKYLRKGRQVLVDGRLQYEAWEKNGERRSRLRVRAGSVLFLGESRGPGEAGNGNGNGGVRRGGAAKPQPASVRGEGKADGMPF